MPVAVLLLCGLVGAIGGVDDLFSQKCKPFKCPSGKDAMQKRPLKLTSPGCTGFGGGSAFTAPGMGMDKRAGEEVLTSCCHMRHACYGICGMPRKRCDTNFDECMEAACNGIVGDEDSKKNCESAKTLHGLTGKLGDCSKWEQAQAGACKCVTKAKAPEKRKQILSDFYKKYNSEKVASLEDDKFKAVVSTQRKFATMLHKVITKYPDVIKFAADPFQQQMEEMMKNMGNKDKEIPTKDKAEEEEVAEEEPNEAEMELDNAPTAEDGADTADVAEERGKGDGGKDDVHISPRL